MIWVSSISAIGVSTFIITKFHFNRFMLIRHSHDHPSIAPKPATRVGVDSFPFSSSPPHTRTTWTSKMIPTEKSPTFRCIGAPSLVVPPERTSGGPWAATTVPQVGEAEQDEAEGVAVGEQEIHRPLVVTLDGGCMWII